MARDPGSSGGYEQGLSNTSGFFFHWQFCLDLVSAVCCAVANACSEPGLAYIYCIVVPLAHLNVPTIKADKGAIVVRVPGLALQLC